MKRVLFLPIILLCCLSAVQAQDYKVESIVKNASDMTARNTILTEKPNGGKQCAVLRIATQNIPEKERNAFMFECDFGSTIRERRKDGGEILLWVSPGLKTLKIKHTILGNYIVSISDYLDEDIQSLNTYTISIVGKVIYSDGDDKENDHIIKTIKQGSCGVLLRLLPEDASLFINNDSLGKGTLIFWNFAGEYEWTARHPLFQEMKGTIKLEKNVFDTIDIMMEPNYGFIQIGYCNPDVSTSVIIDGLYAGKLPYKSGCLPAGKHQIAFGNEGQIDFRKDIEIQQNCTFSCQYHEVRKDIFNVEQYPLTGTLKISTTPADASIKIDNIDVGALQPSFFDLPIGKHNIQLYKHLCTPVGFDFFIVENDTVTKNVVLATECLLSVTTDGLNDIIYLDGQLKGTAPLKIETPYGKHTLTADRDGHKISREVDISDTSETEMEINMTFGQLVHFLADRKSASLFVDGMKIGRTPIDVYLSNGTHSIKATKACRVGQEELIISEGQTYSDHIVTTKLETPVQFIKNGFTFLSGNLCFDTEKNKFFGLTVGTAFGTGWSLSLESGTDYRAFGTTFEADENGNLQNGTNPGYTDDISLVRASALLGMLFRVGGPIYLKIGVGYGFRTEAMQNATDNTWVKNTAKSWNQPEFSAGLQCSIYYLTLSADWQIPLSYFTTNNKMYELRFGIGFNFKYRE